MIKIIDYGIGNLRSVQKAFEKLGYSAEITNSKSELKTASHIILPGVGAFADGIAALKAQGMDKLLPSLIAENVPFLGICLGMQLLFEESEENGLHSGLGIFKGRITKMIPTPACKIPHMGWNPITGTDELLFGEPQTSQSAMVYFVHSYFLPPSPDSAASCTYSVPFTAAVRRGNCIAMQFHPEKSGDTGLAMLNRFAKLKQ